MFKNSLLLIPLLLFISLGTFAQTKPGAKPNSYSKSTSMRVAPPISSKKTLIPPKNSDEEIRDGRYSKDNRRSKGKLIIGKGSTGDDILAKAQNSYSQRIPGLDPELVFDTTEKNSQPTDPSLAIGPDHVLAVFNTGWRIFDKTGNPLTAEISPNNIFSPNSCCDLTISYDNAADRWVMSILYSTDGHVEVAVTQGPDPINDAWSVYSFDNIQDYQKVSVWSDGYYMTANVNSGSAATSDAVFALERDAMLAGAASAQIIAFPLPGIATDGFYAPQAFNVSNDNLPATGNAPIVYMQDDAFSGITEDHIKIWTINVDFTTPANSTISQPTELATTPFIGAFDGGSFANLTQPGGQDIDALQNTIMNQAQFRKFPTHNSALFNFVVDTDGGAGEIAGVRWYELRQSGDGQPWTIYQEGTYTSPDGKNAWNASLIMDDNGNIGMGYTGMGGTTDTFVSSYYTGRFADDPLGTMTIDETLIAAGGGNIPGSERYGDYSKIDIDPSNGEKFWFVNEYVNAAGNRANVAGVFQIAPSNTNDVGVISINLPAEATFTNAEDITIDIRNFGSAPASNFEVSYQVDGGATVTETFTGTIESASIATYTFTQTADLSVEGQTYTITASTNLTNDELDTNDQTSIMVTHLAPNDIGAVALTSPVSSDGLGNETITITIENFGTQEQSNFDVSYSVNGNPAVTETVTGPLAADSTLDYTFTQTADLSQLGSYEIVVTTLLSGDANASNNSFTATVENLTCNTAENTTPVTISASGTPTITSEIEITDSVIILDLNVSVNIEHTWNEDLTITLTAPDNTTSVELTSGNGGNSDNYINTMFDDEAANPITGGTGPFTGTFQPEGSLADFNGLSSAGTWTLTVSDGANQDGGQLLNWNIEFCEVEEVTLGVDENLDPNNPLQIIYKENNQFEIRFESEAVTDQLDMDIFNLSGQRLLNYRLDKINNVGYVYDLDMSYASAGIYLVRIKDKQNKSKIKRFVVR
ncbi:proprotein convertase P-domain-containing protein [Aquimarina litoralis]|uniref:proprotein convertase P-domain-containing protein n=1 Tax=Aquimarina litoralis TaxID=584605 RepID=UPI001C5603CE|nr:proprotein convertase P-domain-containing protein [Aquimarina litoralis]MBW1295851.1 T9SS type A sorting domain-containing protein [Aquimarina litoralis]